MSTMYIELSALRQMAVFLMVPVMLKSMGKIILRTILVLNFYGV